MTYPIEQFVTLARANGQLALGLAEIARTGGTQCAEIGRKSFTDALGQFKGLEPGKFPKFSDASARETLAGLEAYRDEALAGTRQAFEEWQAAWAAAFAQTSDASKFAAYFERATSPWLKGAAAPAKAPATSGAAKTPPKA